MKAGKAGGGKACGALDRHGRPAVLRVLDNARNSAGALAAGRPERAAEAFFDLTAVCERLKKAWGTTDLALCNDARKRPGLGRAALEDK
jgi:hypothetical protein